MTHIDRLIENGTNFRVDRKDGTASFRSAGGSEADLQAFEPVVRDLREHQGDGLVDLVLVTLQQD